jgi:Tol biopolymer transport system component
LFRNDLGTGEEQELLTAGRLQAPQDMWPDRNALVYMERAARGNFDVLMLPLTTPAGPSPLLASRFDEQGVRVAPNGRAFAFVSNESGQYEVYIAPLPMTGGKTRVSTGGAARPRWTRDGRELVYLSVDQNLVSVPVRTAPSLQVGTPKPLFPVKTGTTWGDFDVSLDGNRFLAVVVEVRANEQPVTLVLNGLGESAR